MSSPTLFLGLLVLAALLVGLFVAWPLLRRRPAGIDAPAADAARLNQDIIRERRQKLDEELAALPEGSPEREALMREFAAGALADLAPADTPGAPVDAPRRRQLLAVVFITLLVALPLAFYRTTGMPEAVVPDFAEKSQMPDVNKMLAQLEARLEAEPEMVEGWLMLGRSRLALAYWEPLRQQLKPGTPQYEQVEQYIAGVRSKANAGKPANAPSPGGKAAQP